MFTPELTNEERGEIVLLAAHSLEHPEAVTLSIAFNRARVEFARRHAPAPFSTIRLKYDVRGQTLDKGAIQLVQRELGSVCTVEFRR